MTSTLTQKIIAHAAGRDTVSPGEIVTCKVDLAMIHDSGGPRRVQPILDKLGIGVWNPEKVVLISDHYVPAVDAESARILDMTRKFASDQNLPNFYDMQGNLPCGTTRTGSPETGNVRRRRGQSFTDGRRLRVLHVRDRRDRYGRCLGNR